MSGHADNIAEQLIKIGWEHDGKNFYGLVLLGDVEIKRFSLTRNSYEADECAPCESTAKRLRNEVAKKIREVYGE